MRSAMRFRTGLTRSRRLPEIRQPSGTGPNGGHRRLAGAVLGTVLMTAPGLATAVETAAHGAHLAWCAGVSEVASEAGDSAAAETLMSALHTRIGELQLDASLVDPEIEKGRRAARAYTAAGNESRLRDALAGCRTSLATGAH